jgi:alkanesulfonate monooxygenase SsuD/methylene tetrahydromethanopterin reductase-like flavin-dependent oxidoreductase (luciferase family)
MRYAIDVAPMGEYADPRRIVALAVAAERAGWDGLSTWDVLGTSMHAPAADPFVALAAVASATERIRLITSVIVLPRRRPQLVTQAAATLDAWSGGRLVLGVGSGGDGEDFTAFGEPFEAAERVARLDRDMTLIDGWLRGTGEMRVGPRPEQQPRPPIWVGGSKPGALRRAAAWDGWVAVATADDYSTMRLSAEAFGEMVDRIREHRAIAGRADEAYDVALFAHSDPGEEAMVDGYAQAGATWWLESLSPLRGSHADLLARIEAGPPRR